MSSRVPKTIERPRVDGILDKLADKLGNVHNSWNGIAAARLVDELVRERIRDPEGKMTEKVPNPAHPDNQDSLEDDYD